jgi:D-cysteine desulfhydrase
MHGSSHRDPREHAALFRHVPALATRVAWATLGDWPTPISEVRIAGRPLWVKCEGDSNRAYGGNKVRTLEAWLGHARASGAERIWAIGAYGSNHAIATVIHARALGLEAGAILFPQPASEWAIENAGALIAAGCPIVRLRSVVEVPFAGVAVSMRDRLLVAATRGHGDVSFARESRDGAFARATGELTRWARPLVERLLGSTAARRSIVMAPGGATPIGTLGAMSAAFELAEQIAAGIAPPPRRIVLPVGSTCTTAGLLSGLALAHALGIWPWPPPIVHGVCVTPWPVTSRFAITMLANATLARVAALGGPRAELDPRRLVVDRRELGGGYGRVTPRARDAMATFAHADAIGRDAAAAPAHAGASAHAHDHARAMPRLDGVYSAKAAAALLRLHREHEEPLLFWSTKSTTLLDKPSRTALATAPRTLARWIAR